MSLIVSRLGTAKITQAIAEKGWIIAESDVRPLKAASLYILQEYATANQLEDNDPQWQNQLQFIFRSNKIDTFVRKIANSGTQSWRKEVENLIESEELYPKGISYGTWQRFATQGRQQAINERGFKAYCAILDLDWQEIAEKVNHRTKNIAKDCPKTDLREAPEVSSFYGRKTELNILKKWIIKDKCRLISLSGIGGIGKTTLVAKLLEEIQEEFDYIIWRSLQKEPPPRKILTDWLKFLSEQNNFNLSEAIDEHINQLINYLTKSRCLLILDTGEAIFEQQTYGGQYREGYEDYGYLLKRIGESRHQSCLILTSREQPREIGILAGENQPIRTLNIRGVLSDEARNIFSERGEFISVEEDWQMLCEYYAGNPLSLKIIAQNILYLMDGNLTEFIKEIGHQDGHKFKDIKTILNQQFTRLSAAEKQILFWIAIEQGSVTRKKLEKNTDKIIDICHVWESLLSLNRRSFIKKNIGNFSLESVIMNYVIDKFVQIIKEELDSKQMNFLHSNALLQATAIEYIRKRQMRLILKPIAEIWTNNQNQLLWYLEQLRSQQSWITRMGYAAGNIINLLCYLNNNQLQNYNFSRLTIRQGFFQGVNLQNVNFSQAIFYDCIFDNINTSQQEASLTNPRLYEGMNITGVKGLTPATIKMLKTLGAVDNKDEK